MGARSHSWRLIAALYVSVTFANAIPVDAQLAPQSVWNVANAEYTVGAARYSLGPTTFWMHFGPGAATADARPRFTQSDGGPHRIEGRAWPPLGNAEDYAGTAGAYASPATAERTAAPDVQRRVAGPPALAADAAPPSRTDTASPRMQLGDAAPSSRADEAAPSAAADQAAPATHMDEAAPPTDSIGAGPAAREDEAGPITDLASAGPESSEDQAAPRATSAEAKPETAREEAGPPITTHEAGPPSLELHKGLLPPHKTPTGELIYCIEYANVSKNRILDLRIIDSLPKHQVLVRATGEGFRIESHVEDDATQIDFFLNRPLEPGEHGLVFVKARLADNSMEAD